MRILVALKQILDPAAMVVNRRAGKVFVNREAYLINPADKRALEAALQIKDAAGGEVIAAGVGPARAGDALREARAMGADRAILIVADEADEAVAARALTALCRSLDGVDLICTGDRALDTGALIGPRLAEALGYAYLGGAEQCTVDAGTVRMVRAADGRRRDFHGFEASLPAVVTFTREAPAPRYPHGGALVDIYRDPESVEMRLLSDLGLAEADLQPAIAERGRSFPPEREFGREVSLEAVAKLLRPDA